MSAAPVTVAIVGSGPGGLSAAARAAETGVSHVLLEASPHLSYTIHRYQKGKHVMDEPAVLPLRASVGFEAGTRERVLQAWREGVESLGVCVRYGAEVNRIEGERGDFRLHTAAGECVHAAHVVLAIGLQGNLNKLGVPGQDLPGVQYQLDDPSAHEGETIVVVGAGDAAIENALALAGFNTVVMLNRRDEFSRAKEANLKRVLKAIENGELECLYNTRPVELEALPAGEDGRQRLRFVLQGATGRSELECDRVVARLGGRPPRAFVESCGVRFPSEDPAAVPVVSPTYESNVPGLYIIGALAGYPLIKQCMNQGFEVVEYIQGKALEPADEGLLKARFATLPGFTSVDAALEDIQRSLPLFAGLTRLQLREFLLESTLRTPGPDEKVVVHNDYTDTFFSVLRGEVRIQADPERPEPSIPLGAGNFFGEMSLISGRRRSATIRAGQSCVLIETPRRSMNRLIQSVDSVGRAIDRAFLLRAVRSVIAPDLPEAELDAPLGGLLDSAEVLRFNPGEALFHEGDQSDGIYLIRAGSVTIGRTVGGRETVFDYTPAGNYVGELALLTDAPRSATVRAAVATEVVRLGSEPFKAMLQRFPALQRRLEERAMSYVSSWGHQQETAASAGDVRAFLIDQGLGEATDVLLIDESLCVRCDNCERACADTHGGTSVLDREAGPTFANIHVPTSCRHCEHPHCMKDCPPDAIHRTPGGEVYIADNCIGCGNCVSNCPYGVIQMTSREPPPRGGLLSWLLFGRGEAPGTPRAAPAADDSAKKAAKCDMCKDLSGGPACVRACPTGAAIRVSPQAFMRLVR